MNEKIISLLVLVFLVSPLFSPEARGSSDQDGLPVHAQIVPLQKDIIGPFSRLLWGTQLSDQLPIQIEALLKQHAFNGNLLIAHHGEILFSGSYGFSDFQSMTPMKLDNQFQLASLSKQFTAMAVMILAQRGLLAYDDLYKDHVPEFPYETVTIRQLLQHTAGMPNYMSLMERHWQPETLPNNEDMLNLLKQYRPNLYFTPGRRFDYSNTGYAMLALLVERLSQEPFDRFLQKEIFSPLAMDNTYLYRPSQMNYGTRQINGYHRFHRKWTVTPDTLHEEIVGDKGIYSTVGDMHRWDLALYEGSLVPKDVLDEAFKPLTLSNGRNWQYGFGFRIDDKQGQKVVFHFGRWNSFTSCIFRNLDTEFTVIMLSNVKHNLDPLQKQIRALLPGQPIPSFWEVLTSALDQDLWRLFVG